MTSEENMKNWEKLIESKLVGRKIVGARYMLDAEVETLGWMRRAIILVLDDGNVIYPSMDDEGNDAGALFTNDEDLETIPVF